MSDAVPEKEREWFREEGERRPLQRLLIQVAIWSVVAGVAFFLDAKTRFLGGALIATFIVIRILVQYFNALDAPAHAAKRSEKSP